MNTTQEIFEKILSNEKLIKEFAEKENENDLYNFCKSIDERCTREEFDEFIFNALESIYSELKSKNYELSPENLENISGGLNMKNFSKKGLASLLATFSMFYTTPSSAMENPRILTPSCGEYIIDTSTDTDYPGASAPPLEDESFDKKYTSTENENSTSFTGSNAYFDNTNINAESKTKYTIGQHTQDFLDKNGNTVIITAGLVILVGGGIWIIKQGTKELTPQQIKARGEFLKNLGKFLKSTGKFTKEIYEIYKMYENNNTNINR